MKFGFLYYSMVFSYQIPKERLTPEILMAFGFSKQEIERLLRRFQQMQPEQIERNRRLMKAGKIDFDEYEEVT